MKTVTRSRSHPYSFRIVLSVVVAGAIAISPGANAAITGFDIVRTESPTFGGTSFGSVGPYDKIVMRARGMLNPADPRNSLITDIALAPKNASGLVEYSMDVYLLKPTNGSKGNGKLFYETVNRGNKLAWSVFNGVSSNDPTTAADAGSGLLMRMGYTIAWSGWEDPFFIGSANNLLTASIPVAKNANGTSITGQTIFEQIFDNTTGTTFQLLYKAATTDQTKATMYVRNASSGPLATRKVVPATVWSYVDNQNVKINRADPFLAAYDNGAAYELVYTAMDPQVLGVGFAATRDLVSFLRYDGSAANPVRGNLQFALAHGQSQSGRYLKGFLHWGFNTDESGRIVFEGMQPFISGAHDIASNDRWGDANATGRKYQRHTIAKQEFPFTYEVRTDPISGKTDGIFLRCNTLNGNPCPKIMHSDSGNEPWLKPIVLVTTDGIGHDITLPDNVRVFNVGSTQHGPGSGQGVCQQVGNASPHSPYIRALFIALDQWTTAGIPPPASNYPRVSDGTAVPPLPQSGQGFPSIPGVRYTGWINGVALLDKSSLPYTPIPGTDYTVLAPKADTDGNDIPGIRTLDVLVPLATYTGWALRRATFAENEDCALTGQFIPFPKTRAARIAAADPRLSIEERYTNFWGYYFALLGAANSLVEKRYILREDAQPLVQSALQSALNNKLLPLKDLGSPDLLMLLQ